MAIKKKGGAFLHLRNTLTKFKFIAINVLYILKFSITLDFKFGL